MTRLSVLPACLVIPVLLAASPALAQGQVPGGQVLGNAARKAAPDGENSKLDELFARLAKAPDDASATEIANAIWRVWLESGSDTVDLLVLRATSAMQDKDYDVALKLLNIVVGLDPSYAEGWNKRATVHYLKHEYDKSISDIRHVLAIEPRHFGAMAGLGSMLKEIGRNAAALEIYRRALAINPHLDGAKRAIRELSVEVEGRDI